VKRHVHGNIIGMRSVLKTELRNNVEKLRKLLKFGTLSLPHDYRLKGCSCVSFEVSAPLSRLERSGV